MHTYFTFGSTLSKVCSLPQSRQSSTWSADCTLYNKQLKCTSDKHRWCSGRGSSSNIKRPSSVLASKRACEPHKTKKSNACVLCLDRRPSSTVVGCNQKTTCPLGTRTVTDSPAYTVILLEAKFDYRARIRPVSVIPFRNRARQIRCC